MEGALYFPNAVFDRRLPMLEFTTIALFEMPDHAETKMPYFLVLRFY
jgi:hypothetical protein